METTKPRLLTRFGDVFYAFDKPAGMAVHQNAEGLPDLVRWLRKQSSLPRDLKPGHRLDRPTSGVVLCGAGKKARAQIAQWLEDGAEKHYLALVAGEPEQDEGLLDKPLYDERRKRPLEAQTLYRVQKRLQGFTLLELQLLTGRKHQLRRHLAQAEMPIVGDSRHGPKKPKRIVGFPNRLWLHAWKLEIPGRLIEASLPTELAQHLEQISGT
ncbi:MAG: RNA pseudouridine synthase [Myxococcota bacterium]|nr:RNA pseudouridine synthase [Myxococcota bacterium]